MRKIYLLFLALSLIIIGSPLSSSAAKRHGTCQGRAATIVGTNGDDVINGTPGRDVIAAYKGADMVFGGDGRDILCGNRGGDRLIGGVGRDSAHGGFGTDACDAERKRKCEV